MPLAGLALCASGSILLHLDEIGYEIATRSKTIEEFLGKRRRNLVVLP